LKEKDIFINSIKEIEKIENEIINIEEESCKNLEDINTTTNINLDNIGKFYEKRREVINERELFIMKKVLDKKNIENRKFNDNIDKLKKILDIIKTLKSVNENLDLINDYEFLNKSKEYYDCFKYILKLPSKVKNNIVILDVNKIVEIKQIKLELGKLTGDEIEKIDKYNDKNKDKDKDYNDDNNFIIKKSVSINNVPNYEKKTGIIYL